MPIAIANASSGTSPVPDAKRQNAMPPVLTVSALTAQIKSVLEGGFPSVDLEAEISGFRPHASGHCYFMLKDSNAQIDAVLFRWQLESCIAARMIRRDELKDGAKVKVRGSVSVYAQRGSYQFVVKRIRPVGQGELMRRYLELKAKLEAEGLFAEGRKRPLPFLPRRIGIVTSESGAVIHDMCTVLTRRFSRLEIRLYPSQVQGADAVPTLVAGIRYFNECPSWRADVLIIARGGGSFEDLFCFNDEQLVRALAASQVPTISAVGHETDYTLCDFVADKRAGTPSIAAEIAVPELSELSGQLAAYAAQLVATLRTSEEHYAQRVDQLTDSLGASLKYAASRAEARLAVLDARLAPACNMAFANARARLERAQTKLDLLSPYSVLDRGYSLTMTADGLVVRDAAALKAGETIHTRLAVGSVASKVANIMQEDARKARHEKDRPTPAGGDIDRAGV